MSDQPYSHNKTLPSILLADDDSDDRELFQEAVEVVNPEIRISMVRDGEELMEYLHTGGQIPDVIFLDLNMPRKNGRECLREIRNSKNHSDIPVIIYTTSLNPFDIEDTFRNGANFFFRKPNSFQELKDIVNHVLTESLYQSAPRVKENFVLNNAGIHLS